MAEINQIAYDYLKLHIQNNWNYVQVKDDLGDVLLRLDTSDPRVNWVHATKPITVNYDQFFNPITEDVAATETMEMEIVLTGSDADLTLPVTIGETVIINELGNDTGHEFSAETFAPFTMTQAEDKLTITHSIEVPKVTA